MGFFVGLMSWALTLTPEELIPIVGVSFPMPALKLIVYSLNFFTTLQFFWVEVCETACAVTCCKGWGVGLGSAVFTERIWVWLSLSSGAMGSVFFGRYCSIGMNSYELSFCRSKNRDDCNGLRLICKGLT